MANFLKSLCVGRSGHVCPCIFVEEDDLNAHRFALGDGLFELLRCAQPGIDVMQWKVPVLAAHLPSGQLNGFDSPAFAGLSVLIRSL